MCIGAVGRRSQSFFRRVRSRRCVHISGVAPERIAEIGKAAERLRDYISGILDERRRRPRDDFLSAYLAAATEAGEMSPEEMLYQILLLITAGTDATRVSIAIQTSLLLQHRRQWTEVCRDPALIPAAVAEALRFEPSSAGVRRIASEDIEASATVIPAGEIIYLSTMSALRDERSPPCQCDTGLMETVNACLDRRSQSSSIVRR